MNTLGRLDAYVFTLLSRRSASPSSSLSPSRQYTRPLTPTLEKDALSIPPPSARLSNLPPTPRKRRLGRRKPTTSNIKVPPPTTPFLLRIILALWSILLSFWRSLVGETRAERGKKRRKRTLSTISQVLNPVDHDVEIEGEGSASEAEGVIISDDEGWTDPVSRAPVDEKLDVPSEDEFSASSMYSQDGKNREVSVPRDDLTPSKRAVEPGFTFRLRSAEKRNSLLSLNTNSQSLVEEKDAATLAQTPNKSSQPYKPSPSPTSILSNPIPSIVTHDANNTTPPGKATRQNRLLPNPMSTSLLDPSVPATPASRTFAAAISNSSSGRSLAAPPRLHHTPFHLRKTLILDLDETLIHSTSRPLSYAASAGGGLLGLSFGGLLGGRGKRREGHTVEVVIGGRSTTYHVYKRPYVDHFLKKVASWYTLVIFTASMPEYADPVIDWLDGGRGLFAKRLYRESCCYQPYGSYVKDLALVEADLSRVCFMDNSPVSYMWNKANALPIEGWTHDPNDEALLHCIPVLDSLRFVNDVRRILGIRGFS